MPSFATAKGEVFFRSWPVSPARARVIFLHGLAEHTGFYGRFAAKLNAAGFSVWALDHVGHGLSYGERGEIGSIDELADNAWSLAELARAEEPGCPAVVIGHSMGAVTALRLAQRPGADFAAAVLTGAPVLGWSAELVRELSDHPPRCSNDPDYRRWLSENELSFENLSALKRLSEEIDKVKDELLAAETFDGPTLLVNGELDVFAPPETVHELAGRLGRTSCVVIDGGLHHIINDSQHAEVAEAVVDFLASATAPESPISTRNGTV